jgi:hypothetical protein
VELFARANRPGQTRASAGALAGSRDGKGKAWVRFYDGDEAIVSGSRIER